MKTQTYLRAGVAALAFLAGSTALQAEVTVLGWPGGPEETALRAVTEIYNAKADVAAENKVELLFTSREGFFDKLLDKPVKSVIEYSQRRPPKYRVG